MSKKSKIQIKKNGNSRFRRKNAVKEKLDEIKESFASSLKSDNFKEILCRVNETDKPLSLKYNIKKLKNKLWSNYNDKTN